MFQVSGLSKVMNVEELVEWELAGETEVLKLDDRGSFPCKGNIFLLFSVCGGYSACTGGCFPLQKSGRSVKLTTHFQLVLR
jgi:hypothetical protein